MISGYLSASFDLLDIEDLDVIEQARGLCDRLVVGIFTDDAVSRTCGVAPVVGVQERAELVRHVRGVDDVVLHETFPGDPGSAGGWALFVVADSAYPEPIPAHAVSLTPRRRTASPTLQRNAAAGRAVA